MDLVSDITAIRRRFRVIALTDEVTRECIAIETDTSITGKYVTRYPNRVILFCNRLKEILSDTDSNLLVMSLKQGRAQHLLVPVKPYIMVLLKT